MSSLHSARQTQLGSPSRYIGSQALRRILKNIYKSGAAWMLRVIPRMPGLAAALETAYTRI